MKSLGLIDLKKGLSIAAPGALFLGSATEPNGV
jgi:hypothetical protein